MPFHHLISKVGFRIFIDDPQPTTPYYTITLKNIKISVVKEGFITASNTYTAEQGLLNGTFASTQMSADFPILHNEESANVYSGIDLRQYRNKNDALDLCSKSKTDYKYLYQIPQKDFKIRVELQLETVNDTQTPVEKETFTYSQLLSIDKTNTTGDLFKWDPETRYIYYLHIPNLHKHEIFLNTCEILPWDEVQTTNIDVGL